MKKTDSNRSTPALLSALADPLRLRACRLLERRELSVGEVAKVFQTAQSSASRNLRVLRDAEWVRSRSAGPATFYRMVLDDLPSGARRLWVTVRDELTSDASVAGQLAEDDRRVEAVLAERRSDSLGYFGRVAGEWDDIRGQLFGDRFTFDALLALLPKWWDVADVGCGTGNVAEVLAPHVRSVTAVDQSEPMLAAARRRLEDVRNVRFVVGDAQSLPLGDGSVDAVTLVLVLHHVPDPSEALAEAARVLRPGGVVLVVDMLPHDRDEYREGMGHLHLGLSEEEVEGWCVGSGLLLERVTRLPDDPDGRGPGLFVAVGRAGGGGSGESGGAAGGALGARSGVEFGIEKTTSIRGESAAGGETFSDR